MPRPGDILHYTAYRFPNGKTRNKYFVVLHRNPCLVLITTSQDHRFGATPRPGCDRSKGVFYLPAGSHRTFPKPTFIELTRIFELEDMDLIRAKLKSGRITKKPGFDAKLLRDLLECLAGFREDISDEHWDLIFGRRTPAPDDLQALQDKFNRHRC